MLSDLPRPRLSGFGARNAIDATAIHFRRAELQLKALLDHAGEEARTECCCQPVAFIMASIDAPEGCRSRARTASCLVPPRTRCERVFSAFTGFFAPRLARESLPLVE